MFNGELLKTFIIESMYINSMIPFTEPYNYLNIKVILLKWNLENTGEEKIIHPKTIIVNMLSIFLDVHTQIDICIVYLFKTKNRVILYITL